MDILKTPNKLHRNVMIYQTPLSIPASPLLQRLGYGTGVNVFRLERSPRVGTVRSPWAIKYLVNDKRINNIKLETEKRLHKEANLLKQLTHPNIVGFRGFSKLPDGRVVLAMENCGTALGDLIENRKEDIDSPYPADIIMKVAFDISRALSYLHDEALILHADIKSYNILILNNFTCCKLCDFGISLPVKKDGFVDSKDDEDMYYEGTTIWAAPETILVKLSEISTKSDIFSFGLTLWEMLSLEPPYPDSKKSFVESDGSVICLDDSVICLDDSVIQVDDSPVAKSANKENNSNSKFVEFDTDSTQGNTRRMLPDFEFDNSYNHILELYYVMTEADPANRPSALHLTEYIQKMVIESDSRM